MNDEDVSSGISCNELARIAAIADATRRQLEAEVFLLDRRAAFVRMARSLCARYGAAPRDYLDDVQQVVMTEAWVMVTEALLDPESLAGTRNWEGMLFVRSKWKVRDFIHHMSSRVSGTPAAWKRHHEMRRTLVSLRLELQREPTPQEVADQTNARLRQTRKDPERQGILCSPRDLQLPGASASLDEVDEERSTAATEDFLLHPVEGREVVRKIVVQCRETDEPLGRFAAIWLADVYTSGGRVGPGTDTLTHIAKTLGLTRKEVLTYQDRVRQVGIEMLREAGVEPPD